MSVTVHIFDDTELQIIEWMKIRAVRRVDISHLLGKERVENFIRNCEVKFRLYCPDRKTFKIANDEDYEQIKPKNQELYYKIGTGIVYERS